MSLCLMQNTITCRQYFKAHTSVVQIQCRCISRLCLTSVGDSEGSGAVELQCSVILEVPWLFRLLTVVHIVDVLLRCRSVRWLGGMLCGLNPEARNLKQARAERCL